MKKQTGRDFEINKKVCLSDFPAKPGPKHAQEGHDVEYDVDKLGDDPRCVKTAPLFFYSFMSRLRMLLRT